MTEHEGGGRWVGCNKLVELKKKKNWEFYGKSEATQSEEVDVV